MLTIPKDEQQEYINSKLNSSNFYDRYCFVADLIQYDHQIYGHSKSIGRILPLAEFVEPYIQSTDILCKDMIVSLNPSFFQRRFKLRTCEDDFKKLEVFKSHIKAIKLGTQRTKSLGINGENAYQVLHANFGTVIEDILFKSTTVRLSNTEVVLAVDEHMFTMGHLNSLPNGASISFINSVSLFIRDTQTREILVAIGVDVHSPTTGIKASQNEVTLHYIDVPGRVGITQKYEEKIETLKTSNPSSVSSAHTSEIKLELPSNDNRIIITELDKTYLNLYSLPTDGEPNKEIAEGIRSIYREYADTEVDCSEIADIVRKKYKGRDIIVCTLSPYGESADYIDKNRIGVQICPRDIAVPHETKGRQLFVYHTILIYEGTVYDQFTCNSSPIEYKKYFNAVAALSSKPVKVYIES